MSDSKRARMRRSVERLLSFIDAGMHAMVAREFLILESLAGELFSSELEEARAERQQWRS